MEHIGAKGRRKRLRLCIIRLMEERQPSKLQARVRFPHDALALTDRRATLLMQYFYFSLCRGNPAPAQQRGKAHPEPVRFRQLRGTPLYLL